MKKDDTDWLTIRADYVTDPDSSYKKIAKKYGKSPTAVSQKACREGWWAEKQQHMADLITKTMDAHKEGQVERLKRLLAVTDILVDKIEELVVSLTVGSLRADKQGLKSITGAIKDIKDIQQLRSQMDIDEQQARIDKLRKDVERQDADTSQTVHIVMESGLDEFAE